MKKMLVMFLSLSMVFAMAACGSKNAEPEKTTPQTTTETTDTGAGATDELKPEDGATLLVWESKEERPFVEEIAKQFTEKYGVTVKFDEVGAADQVTKLTTDGPAGIGADVVVFPHDNLGRAVTAGLVLPNDVFGEQSAANNSEIAVKATSYDGVQYGYPRSVETYAMFYNKDLVPTPPKTFDEVKEFAAKFNDKKANKYAYMWEIDNFYFAYSFLATTGGYIFGKDGTDKTDIGLNNDGAVQGAKFYGELAKSVLPLKTGDVNYDIKKGLFTSGTLAMDINGPWATADYKKAGIKLGVAPIPTIDGKPTVSFAGIKAWYVNAFSKYPNAARLFADFASTKEAQLQDFKTTGALPVNKEAMEDAAVKNDEIAMGFLEQFKNSQPMPTIPEMGSIWDPAKAAMSEIWNNGADAKQKLENAVKQITDSINSAK